ncbi:zinc-binding alcohol dehydrogenase family protein [Chitinophaga sp. 30R24]|uniref:quinone oxidoreductase family protein n=1 Tax=Chitinophaga sp. 30R24 TaxID=3248838 RepID=UPI003B90FF08
MQAAIVTKAGEVPQYGTFTDPVPEKEEKLVKVKAAAIHQVVKLVAAGTHYSSGGHYPFVAGVDGVGELEDGSRVYFVGMRKPYGTMAEWGIGNSKWMLPLPDGVSDVTAAAIFNPAMSSWLALRHRAQLQPGETVLILGATGTSGKLAVQIAKEQGAGKVIAVGRNKAILEQLYDLGADECIALDKSYEELVKTFAAQSYDVVIDYLWGEPATALIEGVTGKSLMKEAPRTRFIQVGAMAGSHISLPAAPLRSTRLEIMGSGGGSIAPEAIFAAFPEVISLAAAGRLTIHTLEMPLKEVTEAWHKHPADGSRIVLVP